MANSRYSSGFDGYGGSYAGSSGYYAEDPSMGPHGGIRPGYGYPGDQGRIQADQLPLDPSLHPVLDTPQWDPVRAIYVNKRTGLPFSGRTPDGRTIKNGANVMITDPSNPQGIDPNNPAQRYKPVDIVKSPAVANATSDLMKEFTDSAKQSLKGFDDFLTQYRAATKDAVSAGKAATDITPTVNALQSRQGNLDTALNDASVAYKGVNDQNAAAEQGIVKQANDLLPSFDAAGQAIADRQMAEVGRNLSRYKVGSGTPRSVGSDESRILAQGAADVMLPLKQAEIGQRYNILNNLELPVQRDIANRETQRVSQFNPQIAQQEFASGQATAQTIQGLKDHVANMDWQQATQLMQSLGVPAAIQQQILAGQAANLGALSNLEGQSHYQGLQDVLGANLTQPQNFSFSAGGYPVTGRSRYPTTLNTATNLGGNAPVQVAPATGTNRVPTAVDLAYRQQTGVFPWEDPNFSQYAYQNLQAQIASQGGYGATPARTGPTGRYDSATGYVVRPDGSAYDPSSGRPDISPSDYAYPTD